MELEHLIQTTFTILTTLHSFLLANLHYPTTLHSFLHRHTFVLANLHYPTTLHSFLQSHAFILSKLHYPHYPIFLPSCRPALPSQPYIPSYRVIPSFLPSKLHYPHYPTFLPTEPYFPSILQSYTSLTTLHSFLQRHTYLLENLHYNILLSNLFYPTSIPPTLTTLHSFLEICTYTLNLPTYLHYFLSSYFVLFIIIRYLYE